MISLLAFVSSAWAWECLKNTDHALCDDTVCRFAPGNSLTYHLEEDNTIAPTTDASAVDMSADTVNSILDAAAAWHAGSGQRLRGANWEFIRGSNALHNTGNGQSEIAMLTTAVFDVSARLRPPALCRSTGGARTGVGSRRQTCSSVQTRSTL